MIYTSTTNIARELPTYCPRYRPCVLNEQRKCGNVDSTFVAELEVIKTKFYNETNTTDALYKDGLMTFYASNYLSHFTEYEHNKEETKR